MKDIRKERKWVVRKGERNKREKDMGGLLCVCVCVEGGVRKDEIETIQKEIKDAKRRNSENERDKNKKKARAEVRKKKKKDREGKRERRGEMERK